MDIDIRIDVGRELQRDVRLLRRVRDPHRIGRRLRRLERIGHHERNILPVVAHNIVLERRPTLVTFAA